MRRLIHWSIKISASETRWRSQRDHCSIRSHLSPLYWRPSSNIWWGADQHVSPLLPSLLQILKNITFNSLGITLTVKISTLILRYSIFFVAIYLIFMRFSTIFLYFLFECISSVFSSAIRLPSPKNLFIGIYILFRWDRKYRGKYEMVVWLQVGGKQRLKHFQSWYNVL